MVFVDRKTDEEWFTDRVMWGDETDCWPWCGPLDKQGYGQFNRKGKNYRAHRWLFEWTHGSVDGFDLDHLCRNKRCVNPTHLEAVSHSENVKRSRHLNYWIRFGRCANGHDVTVAPGVYTATSGAKFCRKCNSESKARAHAKQK